jgi:hypothetical protein
MTTPTQKTHETDEHREDQLDQGLEDSFPASDPVSIQTDKTKRPVAPEPAADKSKSK